MWIYRKLLKISWTDKKTNEEVLKMLQAKLYVITAIKKRKTIYFGHMMKRNNIQRVLVDGQVEGRRCRGRPRTEWTRNVSEWIESTSYAEMVRMTQDRRCWRQITLRHNIRHQLRHEKDNRKGFLVLKFQHHTHISYNKSIR